MIEESKTRRRKPKKKGGWLTKVVGAACGTVLVPIVVAVAIKWLDPSVLGHKDPPATDTGTHTTAPITLVVQGPGAAPGEQKAAAVEPKPKPGGNLLSPRLADHFYSYTWSVPGKHFARNEQVDSQVFEYVERSPGPIRYPAIHAEGGDRPGLLATKEDFDNYTLDVLWKWGEKTYGRRAAKHKRASVLLHITGPDGGAAGIFPQCVSVQLHEGKVGSLHLMGPEGVIRCQTQARDTHDGSHITYDPAAPSIPLIAPGPHGRDRDSDEETAPKASASSGGPKGWDGVIYRREVETPTPPWNRLRIESDHGTITVYVNGKLVNQITGCTQARGRIGFSYMRAEWYVGRIELTVKGAESGSK